MHSAQRSGHGPPALPISTPLPDSTGPRAWGWHAVTSLPYNAADQITNTGFSFSARAAPPAGWGWSTGTVGAEDVYRSILDDRGQSTCCHGAISALNDDVLAVPGSSAVLLVSPNQMLYMLCPAASLRGLDQMLAVYWSRRPDGLSIESDALSERGTGRQQCARSSVDRASDFGLPGRMLCPPRGDWACKTCRIRCSK